jgi:hypothetical protein
VDTAEAPRRAVMRDRILPRPRRANASLGHLAAGIGGRLPARVRGYVIIHDYGAIPSYRGAVHDFRESHGVTEEIECIDWAGAFPRKEAVDLAITRSAYASH